MAFLKISDRYYCSAAEDTSFSMKKAEPLEGEKTVRKIKPRAGRRQLCPRS